MKRTSHDSHTWRKVSLEKEEQVRRFGTENRAGVLEGQKKSQLGRADVNTVGEPSTPRLRIWIPF